MRGVVSGAMVAGLEQLNLLDCFDAVYGSSAGAIAGAYFIAGQARFATTIFYDKLNNSEFIDPWRIFAGKPILSLEYLLDNICRVERPLMVDRVLSSKISLNIVCTSVSKLRNVVLSNFDSANDLFDALRCSARIPLFAGPPVEYRGDRFLDASVYESVPYKSAIADGATDIVALLTRPARHLRSDPSWLDRAIVARYLRRLNPDLATHYLDRAEHYREEMRDIDEYVRGEKGVNMLKIQIGEEKPIVSSYEKSRTLLLEGAMNGFQAVYRALGLTEPDLVEVIAPVGTLPDRVDPYCIPTTPPAQREEKVGQIT